MVAPYTGAWIEIKIGRLLHQTEVSLLIQERGLKFNMWIMKRIDEAVAPYTGAWIEISVEEIKESIDEKSLLIQERGLKLIPESWLSAYFKSLLIQERGLKWRIVKFYVLLVRVAPYTGAWIEINYSTGVLSIV